MKGFFTLFLILAFSIQAFNQVPAFRSTTVQPDYLKKSKNQKTVGWVFLGTGTAMVITGGLIGVNSMAKHPYGEKEELAAGSILIATGIILDLASIPLFITATHNKKKAATLGLTNENVTKVMNGSIIQSPMPSLSFRISL